MNDKLRKGISLIALMITILVLATLSAIVVLSAKNSVDNSTVTEFISDLQKIEDATKNYYIKENKYPYYDNLKLSQAEILELVGSEKRAYLREEMEKNGDYKEDGKSYYYEIDLSKIDVTQTSRGISKNGDATDVFVVSISSGNVYYLKGIETKDDIYFSMSDKIVKLYSVNEPETPIEEDIDTVVRVTFDYLADGATVAGNTETVRNVKYGSTYGQLPSPSKTKTYTVSYEPNGGTLSSISNSNTKAVTYYSFEGWFRDNLFSSIVTSETVQNSLQDHTLYAKWKVDKLGTVILPNVTRENYIFDSWYSQDGKNVGGIGEEVEVASNITLSAHWRVIGHTVTIYPSKEEFVGSSQSTRQIYAPETYYEVKFDANGGSCEETSKIAYRDFSSWSLSGGGSINSASANPVTYTFGDTNATLTAYYKESANSIQLPNAEREGYTFDGWYTDPEHGVKVGKYGESYSTTSNITLYAHYTKNAKYDIEHYIENANDSEYTLSRVTQGTGPIGETVTATPLEISGFYYDGSVIGTIDSGSVASDGSLTLKLYYKRNRHTLTLTTSGGSGRVFTPGEYKNGQTVEISASPNPGSEFVSWTVGTSSVEFENYQSATTTFVMPDSDVTITANLSFNAYVLTVNPNETRYTGVYGDEIDITVPEVYYDIVLDYNDEGVENETKRSKREILEWTLSGEGSIYESSGNVKFTFGAGDATLTASYADEGEAITLPKVSKIGSTFLGWKLISTESGDDIDFIEFTDEENEKNYIPEQNLTAIAVYETIKYNLTVNPSGESYFGDYNSNIEIKAGDFESCAIEFNASGGSFDEEGEEVEKIVVESSRVFNKWVLSGGGSINSATENPVTYTFGTSDGILEATYLNEYEEITLLKPNDREGYEFGGWYSDEDLTQKVGNANESYTPTQDIVLYAKWEEKEYTLTINPGEEKITGKYGSKVSVVPTDQILYTVELNSNGGSLPDEKLYAYKKISGWTKVGAGSIYKDANADSGWIFEFGAGDATISANYTGEVLPVTLPEPSKSGCSFEGWYSDASLSQKVGNAYENYMPTSDITLYANYYNGVARIGSVIYQTLQAAINAVSSSNGSTYTKVELLTNISINETLQVSSGKNVELDLGRYSITSTVDAIENNGALNIVGNSLAGKVISTGGIAIKNAGTLTLSEVNVTSENDHTIYNESGTITVDGNSQIYGSSDGTSGLTSKIVENVSGSAFNLLSGKVTSNNNYDIGIYLSGSSVLNLGTNDSEVSIENPEVYGGSYGIVAENSTINFYDGVVSGVEKWNNLTNSTVNKGPSLQIIEYQDENDRYCAIVSDTNMYILKLSSTEGGEIVSGNGIYRDGNTATAVARKSEDYAFEGWYDESENLVSTDLSYSFQITQNTKLTAKFQSIYVYISYAASNNYSISSSGNILNVTGNEMELTVPEGKYRFSASSTTGFTLRVYEDGSYVSKLSVGPGSSGECVVEGPTKVKISGVCQLQVYLSNNENATIIKDDNKCTLTLYISNSETVTEIVQVDRFTFLEDSVEDPTKNGYEFLGWSVNEDSEEGTNPYITENATYYAIWKIKTLYVEANTPNSSISGTTYTGSMGSFSYIKLRALANTYKLEGSLTNSSSMINTYSEYGWMSNLSIRTLYQGINTVNTKLVQSENSVVGIIHSATAKFSISDDEVPLSYILNAYVQDGIVSRYDGRYNAQGKVYSTSSSVWSNCQNNVSATTNNLGRGVNYFSFNGNNSYVKTGIFKSSYVTMEAVFSSSNTSRTNEEVVVGNPASGGSYLFIDTDNKITGSAYINGAFREVKDSSTYVEGTLVDVSMTYNGEILCLYINSELVDSFEISGEITEVTDLPMLIGAKVNSDSQGQTGTFFNGNIYSVALYNKALSHSDIESNYEINKLHIYGLD